MKILSIGNFTYGWDGSICDEEHIAGALEAEGHEVTRVQREEHADFLRKYAHEGADTDFDFLLLAQWEGYDVDAIDIFRLGTDLLDRHKKCLIVYWAFDYQADGQVWHEKLIRASHLYLSKRIEDRKYDNWQWLCQDFAPSFLDKYPGDADEEIDVLFTGTYLPWADERNQTLKAIDENYDLHIYSLNPADWMSAGFKKVSGPVMDERLPQLIARSRLSISIDHTLEAGYWSDRNAQIMCCGGLVLFRYIACSTQVFGDYVEYFYDTDSCLKLIHEYLMDSSKRHIKANRGYEFAQANLTVQNRVKDLLTIVGAYL